MSTTPDPQSTPSPAGPVQHVLLDADGVFQHVPTDWRERLASYFGDDVDLVIREAWEAEAPCLRGERDFLVELAEVLRRHGDPTTAAELHAAVWTSIGQVPSSLELVPLLRAQGYGVHLGTNQEQHRAAHMRTALGYDDLFDVSVYSCDLGVAKPDPDYFVKAVALIGCEPGQVLFVDDREPNVAGAVEAGLVGVHWHYTRGRAELESRLAEHGVTLGA